MFCGLFFKAHLNNSVASLESLYLKMNLTSSLCLANYSEKKAVTEIGEVIAWDSLSPQGVLGFPRKMYLSPADFPQPSPRTSAFSMAV